MSLLTQPSELKHNQPISCLIYGQPGTGKTTLALSADKPVLIDLDRGLYRVEKRFQCPSLQVENYQQILDLLKSGELAPFNTIVIDTLGKLVDRMGDYVARQNPKFKQGDGTLSMKAWGAIKVQFTALVKQIFNSNKSVIFVAHEKEDKDDDIRFVRPDVSGSSGKDIVKELDLMGYMEMKGNKRTVSFTPNEKYYAKNALNLPPVIEVPNTASGNTFFQDKIVAAVAEKRRQEAELLADYESLKNIIETKVGEIKDIAGLNEIYGEIRGLQVIWDSQFFANKLLKEKSVELKAKYSKETGKFEVADE
ncbi:MAG: ATP-binding protein [Alphaproteobacteria bacterium]